MVNFFVNTLRRLHLRLRRNRCQLLRNLSPMLPNLRVPRKIHLLPFLRQRTNGRKLVLNTSRRICDSIDSKRQQSPLCSPTCKWHVVPLPNRHLVPQLEADNLFPPEKKTRWKLKTGNVFVPFCLLFLMIK